MRHHGAGDGGALLLAARKRRRLRVHPVAESHPGEEFFHIGAIFAFALALDLQRQRHVFIGGQMVEQAEFLEDDADAPPERRQFRTGQRRDVLPEHGDEAARRAVCQKHELQQRCLARAGRTRQEMEGGRREVEAHIAQHLRSHAVAKPDILEANHGRNPVRAGHARQEKRLGKTIGPHG